MIAMFLPHGYTDGHVYLKDGLLIETLQEYIYWYEVRKAIRRGQVSSHDYYTKDEDEITDNIWHKVLKEYGVYQRLRWQ